MNEQGDTMPSSEVHVFNEPDEYAAALRATSLELVLTANGHFTGKITRIDLYNLWMQRYSESLPNIGHSDLISGRALISFWTRSGVNQLWNGSEIQLSQMVRHSEGEHFYRRSSGSSRRASMSLPMDQMASIGAAIAGSDLTSPHNALILTPTPTAMAKLQRLHAAAGQLAEDAPEVIAHPEAARGLEQALIEAMVACLGEGEVREDRSALRHHAMIMRRFRTVVEENPDQPLYIPELCKAIGASDRTLRACCEEHLGMGPKRYLLLRRMHLARRTLLEAAPASTTVTEIATRFGFWQFGRFAGEYKSLFGELPSVTLRYPRE